LNSKTATFAGAALLGIATLKEGLSTEEDREQLTQAERVIQRDSKSKELLSQRTATTGFAAQIAQNTRSDKRLEAIGVKAVVAAGKSGLSSGPATPNMLTGGVAKAMGVGLGGNLTASQSLSNLGKGII